MAVKNSSINLKDCQIYEEDGQLYLEEFSRDGSETFLLTDLFDQYLNNDERFFSLSIKEKVILEGQEN